MTTDKVEMTRTLHMDSPAQVAFLKAAATIAAERGFVDPMTRALQSDDELLGPPACREATLVGGWHQTVGDHVVELERDIPDEGEPRVWADPTAANWCVFVSPSDISTTSVQPISIAHALHFTDALRVANGVVELLQQRQPMTKAAEVKVGDWLVPSNGLKGIAYRVETVEQTRPGRYRFGFADDKYANFGGADDVMVLR